MNYAELKRIFRELKRNSPKEDLTAHIIFTEDSFATQYPLLSRTYRFNSDNKAFWPNMGGYSIFTWCLDKTKRSRRPLGLVHGRGKQCQRLEGGRLLHL